MKLSEFIKSLQEHSRGNDINVTVCGSDQYAENIYLGRSVDIIPLATPEHIEYTRHLERQIDNYNNLPFVKKVLQGFKVSYVKN